MRLFKSRTTQNVAAGGLITVGTIAGVLAWIRSMWPELLPWDPSADAAIDTVAATVLAPVVSRVIAMWRNPEKGI